MPTSTWPGAQHGEQHLGDADGLLHRDSGGDSAPGGHERQAQDDPDHETDVGPPRVVHSSDDDLLGRPDRLEVRDLPGTSPALDSWREVSGVTTAWATMTGKVPADGVWWRGAALVAERGLIENVKSRSFKVLTGLLLLLSLAAVTIPQILSGLSQLIAKPSPVSVCCSSSLSAGRRDWTNGFDAGGRSGRDAVSCPQAPAACSSGVARRTTTQVQAPI